MPKKKSKARKINQKMIKSSVGICLLISCCIILMLIIYPEKEEIYKLESRIENVEKEKNSDEENYETIGWLRVQGTKIDTPIIGYQRDDMKIIVSKKDYLWNEIEEETLYNKVNVMGHNILNLSKKPEVGLDYFERFEELMSFIYLDFVKENKYIQYTIDGKDYIYKIFAVNFEKQYNLNLYKEGNYTKKELKEYINNTKKESLFDFDVDVDENDKIISLVTCTRMFGAEDTSTEFKVDARMVRENEKLHNYDVEKTENYKEIEKIMKGDEVDEQA